MLVTPRGDVVNDVISGTSQVTNYETTVVVILDGYWEGIKSVSECLTAVLKSYHLHLSNYRCKVHTIRHPGLKIQKGRTTLIFKFWQLELVCCIKIFHTRKKCTRTKMKI